MGWLDFFRWPDINAGVEDWMGTPGAVLLDVRTPAEYREGHIPGSRNVPLDGLDQVRALAPDRETPLFAYCLSGSRSRHAAALLRRMGYQHVTNIGGISGYRGKVES